MFPEQEGMQPIPPPLPPHIPENPTDDFFKYRIDSKDILDELRALLEGKVYNNNTGEYEQKFDPSVNEEGINKILYIVYSCGINKNTFLGNLTTEEIKFKCRLLKKKLALLLFKKYKSYGIKKEMRDLIIATVINQVHSGLSRSEAGREADLISVAASRMEVFNHQQKEQRDGVLSRFSPFGRRN